MRILIIQTAFIGDVILATPLLESIKKQYPNAGIDFLLRAGNQGLLKEHPMIDRLFIWEKSKKFKSLFSLITEINHSGEPYDYLINLQRFLTTGIFSLLIRAKVKIGFKKNPLSLFFHQRLPHEFGSDVHEVDRNLTLISSFCNETIRLPKLYPSKEDFLKVETYKQENFVCIAPTSVWFTKQFPAQQWIELVNQLTATHIVYLLGAPADSAACEAIRLACDQERTINLAGQLSLLASAALMRNANMNYVNDSAPLHIASSMNAPTTAVFCSTVPDFGFGPLAENSRIVETSQPLTCRPCGLHGKAKCPEGHFHCATSITVNQLMYN